MSTNPRARAWLELRRDALEANYARIRGHVGPKARILPMVKADGYGLGAREVVHALEPHDPWGFGVATVDEGTTLRALGVGRPVVVCGPVPPDQVADGVEAGLQLSVSSLPALEGVAAAARALGRSAEIHVDVDTGMGRSGFDWRRAEEWLPRVEEALGPDLRWTGCYTHLHSADEGERSVREQWARFLSVTERIERPPQPFLVHTLNSAGIFRAPEYAEALVRPGIFLYGGRVGEDQPAPDPVVSVRARVVHVRDAEPGSTLGYGATYRATRPERWATLAIGYGDGLPRALGNGGSALVGGRRVPLVGRISMDVTVVDITDVPGIRVGDVATLLGTDGDGEITVDDIAQQAGTISYEILTGWTARLPRVWTRGAHG